MNNGDKLRLMTNDEIAKVGAYIHDMWFVKANWHNKNSEEIRLFDYWSKWLKSDTAIPFLMENEAQVGLG